MLPSVKKRLERLWAVRQTLRGMAYLALALLLVAFYVLVWTKTINPWRW